MSDERIAKLADRVRWLDASRRTIRRTIAIVIGGLGALFMPTLLGDDWPRIHARLTGIALGFALAFMVDLALALTMALWEVRHDRLMRARGLPRAILRKR